jgi:serine/threonine protein kinase
VATIPRFHDIDLRKDQFRKAVTTTEVQRKETAESAIDFAQKILKVLEKIDLAPLPIRICHNDTKLNNILFSKETDEALCLIDLDTLMKGRFLYDFGDAVRTIVNTAPEDERDHSKITFKKELFEAFVGGLAANKSIFSQKEIETLHWGAVLMPFLHGIRALTDYLNGNIYYKVAYENQNLDRCRSLFDFTGKALNELDYMEGIVTDKLG